jgi:predicted ATPase/class 3 adenylate cyclase
MASALHLLADAGFFMTRLRVGLLMSDIEGSTRLLQQLGPVYGDVLVEHRRLMREVIAAHGGHERGTEGDSFFVTFTSAQDAVATAVAAQRSIAEHQWLSDHGLKVRIGVHMGAIEEIADTVVGMAVHETARITSAGHGGQVLASDVVCHLVAIPVPDGSWIDLGPHALKDITQPVRISQLAAPGLRSEFPPLRSVRAAPRRLPAQPSSFIGRRPEVEELDELLRHTRLLTITGAGGAGKSRLALRIAAEASLRYPDGVWFVDLATTVDASAVSARIAAEIGLPDGKDELTTFLASRQALLVLDNCEHLVEAVADTTHRLLIECPALTVLATSREPLGLSGESGWRVPPMAAEDARQLLMTRASAVNPEAAVTAAHDEAFSTICQRLDALPLALELAAARTASLSPEQIAERLDERFQLLTGGHRGALGRHRTLQATVDWSYEMLDDLERDAFGRTGVFAGGFSLEAFESVCTVDGHTPGFDLMDKLVSKSLVLAEQVGSAIRYRLLETMRQYALDRLHESGHLAETRTKHAAWIARLSAEAESVWLVHGGDEAAWLTRLDLEDGNVGAALEWTLHQGQTEEAVAMVFGLMGWLIARGRSRDAHGWATRIMSREPAGATLALAAAIAMMCSSNVGPVPPEEVTRVRETSLLLASTSRSWFTAVLDGYVAAWSYAPGDPEAALRAVPVCELGVDAAGAVGVSAEAVSLQPLIWALFDAGELDLARGYVERGLARARQAGLAMVEGRMAVNLSRITLAQEDLDTAWSSAEHAVGLARGTGEPFVVVAATEQLVEVAKRRGEYPTAAALLSSIIDAVADFRPPEEVDDLRIHIDRLLSGNAVD